MWKSTIACALSIVLSNLIYLPTVAANPNPDKEQRKLQELKAGLRRLGTGPDARIKIKLKNKSQIAGYISEVGEDSFVVVDDKTGTSNIVAYPNVAQAKGNNLSSNQKLAITLAVVGVLAVLIFIGAPKT